MDTRVGVLVGLVVAAIACGPVRDGPAGGDAAPDLGFTACHVQKATPDELARCGPEAPYRESQNIPCMGGAAACTCVYGQTCGSGAHWLQCGCGEDAAIWTCGELHCDPPGPQDAGQPDAGQPDAGQPDAGQPDAGQPDAG